MKHKLTNNWGLKLGSIVFAFFLWIIVTNMNDPVIQYRVYNVPVRFTHTNVVTDQGKTYEVLDNTDVIDTVTISAARSVIDALNNDDVVAVADFNDLTLQNTVSIKLSTNKYNSNLESIKGNIDTVELNIENLKTKTLALSTTTSGTVSDGYIVGNISVAQNQVRISGPESVINQITRAEVNVPVTGFTQDIVTDVDINLLDSEGEKVESASIQANISTVKVDVEILKTKSVGLTFGFIGVAADGYMTTGEITSDPSTVLVAGKSSVLNNLESIVIDSDALNVTGQTGNLMTLVDIRKYLPSGVTLADTGFDGNVTVTVYISPTVNRVLTMKASDIHWENIPDGMKVEIVDPEDEYTVSVNGLSNVINSYNKEEIIAKGDLKNILEQEDKVGSLYHVNLYFTYGGEELKISEPVQVWVKLLNT